MVVWAGAVAPKTLEKYTDLGNVLFSGQLMDCLDTGRETG